MQDPSSRTRPWSLRTWRRRPRSICTCTALQRETSRGIYSNLLSFFLSEHKCVSTTDVHFYYKYCSRAPAGSRQYSCCVHHDHINFYWHGCHGCLEIVKISQSIFTVLRSETVSGNDLMQHFHGKQKLALLLFEEITCLCGSALSIVACAQLPVPNR